MSLPPMTTLAEIDERLGEKAVAEVRKAANTLVQRQFLFAGDRGATHPYATLTTARYRRYFEILFDGLGYRFIHSDGEQWVGLLPDPELDLAPKMKMDHTLVLLLLAHLWQDEVQRGGAEARAVVVTTVNELFESYRDIAGRHRKETLTTARMLEVLRDFSRRGLVALGAFDPEADDHELEIRPMVNRLVDGDALARLESYAPDAEGRVARARAADGADDAEAEDTVTSDETEAAS